MGVALALALVLSAAPEPTADDVFAEGQRLYSEGRYEDAAAALERAFSLDPRPPFLYNWAQAERKAGDCKTAVKLYERFLATGPAEAYAEQAEANVRECARQLAEREEAAPPPAKPVDPPAPRSDPPPPRWHRDALGGVLFGVGSATFAVGLGLRLGAEVVRQRANRTGRHSEYASEIGRARAFAGAGIALLAISGAVIVGTIVRYVVVSRRHR